MTIDTRRPVRPHNPGEWGAHRFPLSTTIVSLKLLLQRRTSSTVEAMTERT